MNKKKKLIFGIFLGLIVLSISLLVGFSFLFITIWRQGERSNLLISPTISSNHISDNNIVITPVENVDEEDNGFIELKSNSSFVINFLPSPIKVDLIHVYDTKTSDEFISSMEKIQETYLLGSITYGIFLRNGPNDNKSQEEIDLNGYNLYLASFGDRYLYVQFIQKEGDVHQYILNIGLGNGFNPINNESVFINITNDFNDELFNPIALQIKNSLGGIIISNKGVYYNESSYAVPPFSSHTGITKVDQIDSTGIYSGYYNNQKSLFLRANDGFIYYLRMIPSIFEGESRVAIITFSNGEQNKKEFGEYVGGSYCYVGNYFIDIDLKSQATIGSDASGGKIYFAKGINDPFFKTQYANYLDMLSITVQTPAPTKLTPQQYFDSKPYFLWVNQYGMVMVFSNEEIRPFIICD